MYSGGTQMSEPCLVVDFNCYHTYIKIPHTGYIESLDQCDHQSSVSHSLCINRFVVSTLLIALKLNHLSLLLCNSQYDQHEVKSSCTLYHRLR